MTRFFKATRPDGTDFRTGTIRYAVGEVVEHPCKKRVRDDPSTYLSVSTVATDCTGMRWPCRLFAVEGIGRGLKADGLPNKRCFSKVRVVEELPAHEVFGPQGADVVALIDRAGRLTRDEMKRLDAAWDAALDAAGAAAWDTAGAFAIVSSRKAAWDAARRAAWRAAWDAARDAAWALVVRDLISPEQFDVLYGPWREAIEEPA